MGLFSQSTDPPAWMKGVGVVPVPATIQPAVAPVAPTPFTPSPEPAPSPVPSVGPSGVVPSPTPVAPIIPGVLPGPGILLSRPDLPIQGTPWQEAIARYLGITALENPEDWITAVALDPTILLWQGLSETGGLPIRSANAEGFSQKLGRNYYSYGIYQINELYASGVYGMRQVAGPTLAALMPVPPADPAPLDAWMPTLTKDPEGQIYGLVFLRSARAYLSTMYNFDPNNLTQNLTLHPGIADPGDAASAGNVLQFAQGISSSTGIPIEHIVFRLYWAAASMQGMDQASKGAFGVTYFTQKAPLWRTANMAASQWNAKTVAGRPPGVGPRPVPAPEPVPVPPPPVAPPPVIPSPQPASPGSLSTPAVPPPSPITPAPTPNVVLPTIVIQGTPQAGPYSYTDLPDGATPLQQAGAAMAAALANHGYRSSDTAFYKTFQGLAVPGSTPDGFPGAGTMGHLNDVLATMVMAMPNVPIYPWHSKSGFSGYDGINAPLWSDWNQ